MNSVSVCVRITLLVALMKMHECRRSDPRPSTVTPALSVVSIDPNRVRVVCIELLLGLLSECILCNRLESLLDVDVLFARRLEIRQVALGGAPVHGPLLGDHSLALLDVDLVSQDDEWEVVWIVWGGLDEELVAPGIEGVKRLCRVDVVDEDTAVGAAVEGYAERLESFLTRCIPEL